MRTLKSKYQQGDLRNKWKIQQCQSEKVYFDYHKECQNCEGRSYCLRERFQPYYVSVASSMLIFADSFENAKEYARNGHGWLIERESIDGMPVEIRVAQDKVTFEPDLER
jgi:hypothetical protein